MILRDRSQHEEQADERARRVRSEPPAEGLAEEPDVGHDRERERQQREPVGNRPRRQSHRQEREEVQDERNVARLKPDDPCKAALGVVVGEDEGPVFGLERRPQEDLWAPEEDDQDDGEDEERPPGGAHASGETNVVFAGFGCPRHRSTSGATNGR